MTLKSQLVQYLRDADYWECGATLERMEWKTDKFGLFKPSTVGRVLRRLEEEGRLQKKEENGTVFYKYPLNDYEKLNARLRV